MLEPYEKAVDLLEKFGNRALATEAAKQISEHVAECKTDINQSADYDAVYWNAVKECIFCIAYYQTLKHSKETVDFLTMRSIKKQHFYNKWLALTGPAVVPQDYVLRDRAHYKDLKKEGV